MLLNFSWGPGKVLLGGVLGSTMEQVPLDRCEGKPALILVRVQA